MKKKIDRCKYNTANIPIGTLKTRRVAKQLSGSYCCWASMGGFRREAFMALMPPHLDFEFGPSVPLAESICKQCKQFVEVERPSTRNIPPTRNIPLVELDQFANGYYEPD